MLLLLLPVLLLTAACYPARLEADWAGLRTIGTEQNILLTYNDRIVMIDPEDGKPVELRNADGEVRLDDQGNARVWEFLPENAGPNMFFANPIEINEETLLAVGYDFKLYEIDIESARLNETIEVTEVTDEASATQTGRRGRSYAGVGVGGVADPVLRDDLLYFGLNARDLIAVDWEDKTGQWTFPTEHGVWSEPLIVDDVMYFTSLDHNLYAANADTGEELWVVDLQGASTSTPILHDDHLYVGSFGRKLFKISLEGEIVAEFETSDWVWGAPTIVDGTLYVGDMSGNVYALDSSDLTPQWQQKVAGRGIRATPLVVDDTIVVGARDHNVYWLNRDDGTQKLDNNGEPLQRQMAGEVLSDIMLVEPSETVDIDEPYVVVSSIANNELLVAFTLEDGEREWTYGR
jgi:outer membrane protein assembly factor BamB